MLQQTLDTLGREFADDSDATIDAAKALVECACRLLVEELDDPAAPLRPTRTDIPLAELLGLATRMLDLGEVRDRAFATLIKEHNRLADPAPHARDRWRTPALWLSPDWAHARARGDNDEP